jgi:hypothetical protein
MSDSFKDSRNQMKGAFYGIADAPTTADSFDWNQSKFRGMKWDQKRKMTSSQTMDIDGEIVEAGKIVNED